MEIRIKNEFVEAVKELQQAPFSFDVERRFSRTYWELNLINYTERELEDLLKALKKPEYAKLKGIGPLTKDLAIWIDINRNPQALKKIKIAGLKKGVDLIRERIRKTPRKHLYKREDEEGQYLAYYVERIEYHPAEVRKEYTSPAYGEISLGYEHLGSDQKTSFRFYGEHIVGKTPEQALIGLGYFLEDVNLRDDYETFTNEYQQVRKKIGCQYLARGLADDEDIDGNPEKRREAWWFSSRASKFQLDKDGEPTKVVVDVFQEGDKSENYRRGRGDKLSSAFWQKKKNRFNSEGKDDDDDDEDDDDASLSEEVTLDEDGEIVFQAEIPIHPYVVIFDLKRHKRLKIHVGNLKEYEYHTEIRESLVLPKEHSDLIDILLVEKTSKFKDVVEHKAGGTIILCQGPPGTGKTLTAEIYAEALGRPLYSVQCSQLGIDIDELESNLMLVLARGRRWKAVMLLDEADVYVHQRGSDLVQNSIVGVFLRVLEYHSSVLFLTTNRGDLVDDAILSRCTIRIPYEVPEIESQVKIWKALAKVNGFEFTDEQISEITMVNEDLSGRDIKNLLKLAMMVTKGDASQITEDLISDLRKFKPTVTERR